MSARKLSAEAARLEDRMAELSAGDEEVAALVGVEPGEVRDWRQGKAEIDPEARVKLRPFLADDPHAAALALERERTKQTRTLETEDWQSQGVDIPYGGGFAGTDAEVPA